MPVSMVRSACACARLRGKPSRMNPRCGIGLGQPFANDSEHDLVGHQLAGVHRRLGAAPILGAASHGAAQQIAGGYLGDAETLDQPLRLGAFSRPRGPHKHDTHPRNSTHRRREGQTRLCARRPETGRLRNRAQGMLAPHRRTGVPGSLNESQKTYARLATPCMPSRAASRPSSMPRPAASSRPRASTGQSDRQDLRRPRRHHRRADRG
jgi:hypothetical protein